jgi:hypothetical protein
MQTRMTLQDTNLRGPAAHELPSASNPCSAAEMYHPRPGLIRASTPSVSRICRPSSVWPAGYGPAVRAPVVDLYFNDSTSIGDRLHRPVVLVIVSNWKPHRGVSEKVPRHGMALQSHPLWLGASLGWNSDLDERTADDEHY